MNPSISRRVARVKLYEPLLSLPLEQWKALVRTVETANSFEDLSPEQQDWVLEAESTSSRQNI